MPKLKFLMWWLWRLIFLKSHLEIELCGNCNLNCKGCSHYSPLADDKHLTLQELKDIQPYLSKISTSFRSIRLLGGEPLLNNEINEIIRFIRLTFPYLPITLVSNGIMLLNHKFKNDSVFWETCKECNVEIVITKYPIKLDFKAIENLGKYHGVNITILRTRPGQDKFEAFLLNPKKKGNRFNYYRCFEMDFLQMKDGKLFSCAQCAYMDRLNSKIGRQLEHEKGDFLELEKIKSDLDIRKFRLRSKQFCKYCVFPRPLIEWKLSSKNIKEWIFNQN